MQSNDALPAEERLDDEIEMTAQDDAGETAAEASAAAPDEPETEGSAAGEGEGEGEASGDEGEDADEDAEAAAEQQAADKEEAFAAAVRMAEALLFAAAEPLDEATLRKRLPPKTRVPAVLAALEDQYRNRGVILKKVAGRWAFMTAPDLQHLLEEHRQVQRKLSRAAIETLAIIAYHQPVTRAEIEEIRGVSLSKGTLDVLMEAEWVKVRGRRRVPGRPVTYGTTEEFLVHFGLESVDALPGLEELRASGLLEALPASGGIPMPGEALDAAPEDPLGEDDDGREFLEPLIIDEEDEAKKAAAGDAPAAEAPAEDHRQED
ncbi:MAG TPA: SMC-Scp complex subunit ScpB [Ferrovibrio sp.]|uniref:SMC-Scp complex subunit ScpB n=1 Tax=Ferrovibrio sp. TaxID=1917215 RepID=UPI002ED3B4E5